MSFSVFRATYILHIVFRVLNASITGIGLEESSRLDSTLRHDSPLIMKKSRIFVSLFGSVGKCVGMGVEIVIRLFLWTLCFEHSTGFVVCEICETLTIIDNLLVWVDRIVEGFIEFDVLHKIVQYVIHGGHRTIELLYLHPHAVCYPLRFWIRYFL